MTTLHYSFIIPVYNRPDEVDELLRSFKGLQGAFLYEIVIVEDGSSIDCKSVVDTYANDLNISYYSKPNSGPGDSRNYGMQKAKGNYFIILDSDCLLPPQYLETVNAYLSSNDVDCFGGPDAAHQSFTNLQKAINFAMTSVITTGGIRGSGKANTDKFQPRSFNMGLSKKAFIASGGFGVIHPGEDPDLSIRLHTLGFKTVLLKEAYVYHKRRISWKKFYQQVHKFGLVRPILNKWHPNTKRLTYWFPTVFLLGFIVSVLAFVVGFKWLLFGFISYIIIAFAFALVATKNLSVAIQSILAIFIQFFGYGYGFLKSTIAVAVLNKDPQKQFPKLFFKHAK
ncbi:glycosyltransferase family 2 protein [Psychroserpens sp. SPM9]|uniref:glycosyltransferase n=1 Tax=Psychroserpens sp. SPM9 TaxID=2975598 RepID=UPI0021A38E5A|nr:glycosyltransferase [Psychroserpens sp. SPM9]MDG5491718.1 glycosyltransferase [Psychroserpens sp. SPM9]